ncbi:hypothetical protein [uncultured Neptuniibacter sp.]|uniref:tautomerase family protein n=1 Tax=uncultured Neptuniibacter sp. TaxID=502143 RepID=UPI00260C84BA|nr:hypothetical protein [uncultured Neptuniibacter sp.]
MPYISVQLSSPIDPMTADSLAQGITHILSNDLGKKEELTAVNITNSNSAQWYIGNRSLDTRHEQSAYVDIKISEGSNSKNEIKNAIAKLYELLNHELDNLSEVSYIALDEVDQTNWGYGGKTQHERAIKRTESGAIDTAFYLNKGRKERTVSFSSIFKRICT